MTVEDGLWQQTATTRFWLTEAQSVPPGTATIAVGCDSAPCRLWVPSETAAVWSIANQSGRGCGGKFYPMCNTCHFFCDLG